MCPGPGGRSATFLNVWKCQALTPLKSNDMAGLTAHPRSGHCSDCHTIISISTSFFILSSPPGAFLFSQARYLPYSLTTPTDGTDKQCLSRCISVLQCCVMQDISPASAIILAFMITLGQVLQSLRFRHFLSKYRYPGGKSKAYISKMFFQPSCCLLYFSY